MSEELSSIPEEFRAGFITVSDPNIVITANIPLVSSLAIGLKIFI